MEKTKLGLSVGVLGAVVCLLGFYGGYVIAGLAVAYVLLQEENEWLKKLAVKVLAILLAFSLASTALHLLPNVLNVFYSFLRIFNVHVYVEIINTLVDFISSALSLCKTLVFLALAWNALKEKTVKVPVLDKLLDKYIQ